MMSRDSLQGIWKTQTHKKNNKMLKSKLTLDFSKNHGKKKRGGGGGGEYMEFPCTLNFTMDLHTSVLDKQALKLFLEMRSFHDSVSNHNIDLHVDLDAPILILNLNVGQLIGYTFDQ